MHNMHKIDYKNTSVVKYENSLGSSSKIYSLFSASVKVCKPPIQFTLEAREPAPGRETSASTFGSFLRRFFSHSSLHLLLHSLLAHRGTHNNYPSSPLEQSTSLGDNTMSQNYEDMQVRSFPVPHRTSPTQTIHHLTTPSPSQHDLAHTTVRRPPCRVTCEVHSRCRVPTRVRALLCGQLSGI